MSRLTGSFKGKSDEEQIVPQHSAILPAYGSKSIHANHMEMTKFASAEDPGFADVSTTLWRWARDLGKEIDHVTVIPQVPYGPLGIPESRSGPLLVEDDRSLRSQSGNKSQSVNYFGGYNNTGGGRVFQGNIDATGNVNVG